MQPGRRGVSVLSLVLFLAGGLMFSYPVGTTTPCSPRPTVRPQPRWPSAALSPRASAAFGVKLGIPKLPPLPQTQGQAPSVAKPLPDGTFEPTLGSRTRSSRSGLRPRPRPAGRHRRGERPGQRRSTAGALLLLLAGAHLRR